MKTPSKKITGFTAAFHIAGVAGFVTVQAGDKRDAANRLSSFMRCIVKPDRNIRATVTIPDAGGMFPDTKEYDALTSRMVHP